MMRRLSLQIYWTFVSILLLFVILLMIAWGFARPMERMAPQLEKLAGAAGVLMPDAARPRAELQALLEEIHASTKTDVSVFDSERQPLAHVGQPLPAPEEGASESTILRRRVRSHAPIMELHLPDGRWVLLRQRNRVDEHWAGIAFLALLAVAVAVGAYPLVRRLTRRLERLRQQVDALGEGNLEARVDIEGRDEIAELAETFNEAAGRIDRLVNAQRNTLAAASHELRSPLTRMRVAIDLLGEAARPEIREQITTDIAELDELIDELLLASRLDTAPDVSGSADRSGTVDLLGLAAEEAARADLEVTGEPVVVRGDRRLLRRALRNLIENARRYGGESPIEIEVEAQGDAARVRVRDGGPGVPAEERERIFEPFYRRAGSREQGDGVGLGLSLVRQIAELHRGSARVVDRSDGRAGSCFEFTIPR